MTEKGEMSRGKAWLIVLVSLIDDVIILAVVGVVLWYFKIKIPVWAMIAIGLVVGTYIFVRTWAVLPSLRKKKITGAEGMIGLEGEVIEPLTPVGVIKVGAEYWKAKSVGEDIAVGEEVEILRLNKLSLEVKRKSQ